MAQLTSEDFRIEDARVATVNGRNVIIFNALKYQDSAYVFCGQFSAPARTAKRNLWRVAAGLESIKPLGPPRKLDDAKGVMVTLDAPSRAKAAQIGSSVSEAIRIALAAYQPPVPQ